VLQDSWVATGRKLENLYFCDYCYHLRNNDPSEAAADDFNADITMLQQAIVDADLDQVSVLRTESVFPNKSVFIANLFYGTHSDYNSGASTATTDEGHLWNGREEFMAGNPDKPGGPGGAVWFHEHIWSQIVQAVLDPRPGHGETPRPGRRISILVLDRAEEDEEQPVIF